MTSTTANERPVPSGGRGLKILDVGDDFFHRDAQGWLWDWYFPVEQSLRLWERHASVEEYRFWGRIADHAAPAHEGKFPFAEIAKVSVCGVRTSAGRGLKSYLLTFPSALVRGFDAVKRADVITFRWPSVFSMLLLPMALLLRRVVVIRVRVDAEHLYKAAGKVNARLFGTLLAKYTRWALRKADVPVCVSQFLKSKYGHSHTHVFNECGVTADHVVAGNAGTARVARQILYVGRLTPEKGTSTLIDAVVILHREGTAVKLVIVGDGPLRDVLRDHAADAGVADIVSFRGNVTERAALYGFFDESAVFALPSNSEGLGCVLLEAMARRLPIVATNVGGIPDLVTEGESGLLVPPADSAALAAAIRRMLDDDRLRERCIARGSVSVLNHTFDRETGGWIALAAEEWKKKERARA